MAKRDNTLRSQIKRKCWNCRYCVEDKKCPTGEKEYIRKTNPLHKACKYHKFETFYVRTNL